MNDVVLLFTKNKKIFQYSSKTSRKNKNMKENTFFSIGPFFAFQRFQHTKCHRISVSISV